MSLQAILSMPPPSGKARPGPKGATPSDHLRALNYRVNFRMTEAEVARMLGVTRPTVWAWCKKARAYPEAKQILAG
jgi:DNA-binding transcriptional regulator YiaG